jgi:hypothetical protein
MSPWLLSLDVVSVLLFVILGRGTHDEEGTIEGFVVTAAPFLIALSLGWLLTRAWRAPASLPVGGGVLVTTIVTGMLLRRFLFDEGTAASFIVVATVFLTACLLGWRLVAVAVVRRRSAATAK